MWLGNAANECAVKLQPISERSRVRLSGWVETAPDTPLAEFCQSAVPASTVQANCYLLVDVQHRIRVAHGGGLNETG
jgi:hypothetical protein